MRDELRGQIMTLLDNAEIIVKAPPEFYVMKDKVTLVIDGKAGIADDILSLIEGELDKAKKYDALFPPAREVWEWQAEAERILYGKVGGYKDALEGKEG